MKEHSVFWLGGRPGQSKPAEVLPGAEHLAPVIRATCAELGLQVEEFVAALGGYGSWLVQFTRNGVPHRVIWNGKDARLSLDRARPHGAWEELCACRVAAVDANGFTAGVRQLVLGCTDTAA